MAGLCAAARARELGSEVVVYEKGDRPGGSMLLSSGFVWRFRTLEDFRADCPTGDERLQRRVIEELDDGLAWLESLGAPVLTRETGNPLTLGWRFDTRGLTDALVRAAGDVRLGTPFPATDGPLVLATGGFQGSTELVDRFIAPAGPLRLRANRWSDGAGLRLATDRGAELSAGMGEFYGRNMADVDFDESQLVPLAQLYGRWARIYNERGEEFFSGDVSWSENDLVQATAKQPGARAWYVVDEAALEERVREHTVREIVAAAPTRVDPNELPFPAPAGAVAAVQVAATITHTIGGLAIDEDARVRGAEGVFAAGADAGGISTGGYASGLAAALVFGRAAAESALS